jgi:hypothetical protein
MHGSIGLMAWFNLEATVSGKGTAVPLHFIEIRGKAEVQLHSFLTLALNGSEWSASQTSCFTPWEGHLVFIEWVT